MIINSVESDYYQCDAVTRKKVDSLSSSVDAAAPAAGIIVIINLIIVERSLLCSGAWTVAVNVYSCLYTR